MDAYNSFLRTFEALKSEYETLRRQCEGLVVEERWASDDMFDLRPLAEQLRFCPGKWLRKPPKDSAYKHLYGLDVQGRPVTEVMPMQDPYAKRWRATLFVREGDVTISACYDHRQSTKSPAEHESELVGVTRLLHKEGLPIQYEEYLELGGSRYFRFEYFCENGRITKVKTADDAEGDLAYGDWEVVYDAGGKVSHIQHLGGSAPSITWKYRRRSMPLTRRQVVHKLETILFNEIVTAVELANISEEVYSIVLGYSSEESVALVPHVAIGTVRERTTWLSDPSLGEPKGILWNPEEYENDLNVDDALLLTGSTYDELCGYFQETYFQWMLLHRSLKILRSVARRLAKHPWNGALRTSDDFTAILYDVENDDPKITAANMKASTPRALMRKFKKLGWV